MNKKLLAIVLSSCLTISIGSVSVLAKGVEKRDTDGTLILEKYPVDEVLSAKKEKLVELHLKVKKGLISKDVEDAATRKFYLEIGDVKRANEVGTVTNTKLKSIGKPDIGITDGAMVNSSAAVSRYSTSNFIAKLYQQPQEKSYYCGPSSAVSILGACGVVKTQSELSTNTELLTEKYTGTPWYADDTTKYVMANVLNKHLNTSRYIALEAPSKTDLQNKVIYNVDIGFGTAANINISKTDTTRPSCYPSGRAISHWIAIEGYSDSGATIRWAEPAYKASCVSWYKSVTTAYPTTSSATLSSCVRYRGIIW